MRDETDKCFISPHGYGHATRCTAVLESLRELRPALKIDIITTVPPTLFQQTLDDFTYYSHSVDIGLIQTSALNLDLDATVKKLDQFLPFDDGLLKEMAAICSKSDAILCDIAPLGIVVGKLCQVPTILLENFTWNWIYSAYSTCPGLTRHREYLATLFSSADFRIQTEPLCKHETRNLLCGPIFRKAKTPKADTKQVLNLSEETLVLVTMGGMKQQLPDITKLTALTNYTFVFTGQNQKSKPADNILFLPESSELYHPDLMAAADIVICKTGYSSVAECCQGGVKVLSVNRADFPESVALQNYLTKKLHAVPLDPDQYLSGNWKPYLSRLESVPQPQPFTENGADSVARALVQQF